MPKTTKKADVGTDIGVRTQLEFIVLDAMAEDAHRTGLRAGPQMQIVRDRIVERLMESTTIKITRNA